MLAEYKENEDDYSADSLITDLSGLFKDLAAERDDLRAFMNLDDATVVYWMEASSHFRSKSLQLYAVPVDVSKQLKELFFDKKKSVILTSATLSVDKSFQYMIDNLGLQEDQESGRLVSVQLPSPFKYRDQALLVIPRDFPSVKEASAIRCSWTRSCGPWPTRRSQPMAECWCCSPRTGCSGRCTNR